MAQKHTLMSLVIYSALQGLPITGRVNKRLLLSDICPHYSLLLHFFLADKTSFHRSQYAWEEWAALVKLLYPACAIQLTSGFHCPRDQIPLLRMLNRKSDYTILPYRREILSMF